MVLVFILSRGWCPGVLVTMWFGWISVMLVLAMWLCCGFISRACRYVRTDIPYKEICTY